MQESDNVKKRRAGKSANECRGHEHGEDDRRQQEGGDRSAEGVLVKVKEGQRRHRAFRAQRVCQPPFSSGGERLADEHQRTRAGVRQLKGGIG